MRINIYDKWVETPEGKIRSFRLCKNPIKRFNTQTMTSHKIMQRLASRCKESSSEIRNSLVVLTDKDYENSLIGTGQEIYKFVRDCLVDEGLMSKGWGRRK
ncbi:MAG: hypothetical protein WC451_02330 [Patescibacteria group bacterium]